MINLDKIKAENAWIRDHIKRGYIPCYETSTEDTIDALVAEVERLRAGLEQYANPDNWNYYSFQTKQLEYIGGELARSLLKDEDTPAPPAKSDKQN